jgi:CheY-like chemotaxis protein
MLKEFAGKRILLCDDEGMIQRALRRIMEKLGLKVVGEARAGEEAVEIALRERPEVILMDYVLEGMDGIEATRQILAVFPTCILMISGYTDEQTRQRALEAGVSGFLPKPFLVEDLPAHFARAFATFCESGKDGKDKERHVGIAKSEKP